MLIIFQLTRTLDALLGNKRNINAKGNPGKLKTVKMYFSNCLLLAVLKTELKRTTIKKYAF